MLSSVEQVEEKKDRHGVFTLFYALGPHSFLQPRHFASLVEKKQCPSIVQVLQHSQFLPYMTPADLLFSKVKGAQA